MSCKKDKQPRPAKAGHFRCSECGSVRKKKGKLCKPKKIKRPEAKATNA